MLQIIEDIFFFLLSFSPFWVFLLLSFRQKKRIKKAKTSPEIYDKLSYNDQLSVQKQLFDQDIIVGMIDPLTHTQLHKFAEKIYDPKSASLLEKLGIWLLCVWDRFFGTPITFLEKQQEESQIYIDLFVKKYKKPAFITAIITDFVPSTSGDDFSESESSFIGIKTSGFFICQTKMKNGTILTFDDYIHFEQRIGQIGGIVKVLINLDDPKKYLVLPDFYQKTIINFQ